jgi:AraC-like DNA-binding protein
MRRIDRFSPPPAHSARFRSDDLDEIHAFIAAYDGSHRRTALDSGPLGYSIHAARCGKVDIGWGATRARQKIRGTPQGTILQLPLGRRHVYATSGRTLEASPDTAILLVSGQEYTLHFEPDDCLVVLRLPGSALADELRKRDPAAAVAGLGMRELPLASGRLDALAAMHRALVEAADPMAGVASPSLAAQLEARLCSWMADQVLGTRPASSTPVVGVQRIRIVEEWIDAHLATSITLGGLCSVSGIGDRWLESAFRSHRGQTPLQFVTRRRLAWVRGCLLDAKPGESVTQIAHNAGIVHLGRFAARYRSTYGESPSTTLRRSLSRP